MSNPEITREISWEPVRSISIDVVVKDLKRHRKCKADGNTHAVLTLHCKNILLNQFVTVNSVISHTASKLAKVYGVADVIVKKIQTKRGSAAGIISESTKINIVSVQSEEFYHHSLHHNENLILGGLDVEFDKLKRLFFINTSCKTFYKPLGILLHGPPGCGKTSFVKILAKNCRAAFYNIEASSLLNSDFGAGADNLKQVFEKAVDLTEEGPVILFLDEIDMICPRPAAASLGNKQLSNALMTQMDAIHNKRISGLLVLAATNSVSSLDPRLRRPGRFDQEILINVPTETQRLSILQVLTASMCLATDVSCNAIAKMTPGFVGADLRSLCEEAIGNAQDSNVVGIEDFDFALHKTMPSLKKGTECVVDLKSVKWSEIGSLDEVKTEIRQSIEWPLKYPEILKSMDIPPAKGILLYGPPGCCKTTLIRAAATSCNVSFLSLSGAQVFSAYVGESERIIAQAFQKARALAPSILFLDEIESIVGKRSSETGNSSVQERILSTLLNEMDGIGTRLDFKLESSISHSQHGSSGSQRTFARDLDHKEIPVEDESSSYNNLQVILVGATNRPDMLDPAILRPGRLDKHIYVPPPDEQARKAILHIYTSKMSCTDVDVDVLALKTNLYSGADLKNLCKEAGLQAVRGQLAASTHSFNDQLDLTVSQHHFLQALNTVKPSLTQELLNTYNK